MELHAAEQDPEPVAAVEKQAGNLAVSDTAEDRAGIRGAEEDSKPVVREVRDCLCLFRLIQKYQNFMK